MATLNKLFALLNKEGLTEQRAGIIYHFTDGRTSSAKELTPAELDEMCDVLSKSTLNQMDELNKKRKRLIASIFGTFKLANRKVSMEYVKAIACRAAKEQNFNHIPPARLDSLYNAFLNAQKDLQFCKKLVEGFINEQICYN